MISGSVPSTAAPRRGPPRPEPSVPGAGYRHEAFFYADTDEFLDTTLEFTRAAVAADEPILVVLSDGKIAALRNELGATAASVMFADMGMVGANPARIIPKWQSFLSEHARGGRAVRGIGEPIGPACPPDALSECHRHEALLNIAFAEPQFWLLCPYDTRVLDESVITEARRTHPYVRVGSHSGASAHFAGDRAFAQPFGAPLDDPPADTTAIDFDATTLRSVRLTAAQWARRAGLDSQRAADFVVSVSELSSNSVRHGGGQGAVRLWLDDGVVCEVRDGGHLTDPMLGRRHPDVHTDGGRGLWLANQLCDLVQVRSFATGTVIRLHMRAA